MTRNQNFQKGIFAVFSFLEFFKAKWPNLGSISCNISNWNHFFTELNSEKIYYQICLFDIFEPIWSFFFKTKWPHLGSVSCNISNWNGFRAELNSKKIFYQIDLFVVLEPFLEFFREDFRYHIKINNGLGL